MGREIDKWTGRFHDIVRPLGDEMDTVEGDRRLGPNKFQDSASPVTGTPKDQTIDHRKASQGQNSSASSMRQFYLGFVQKSDWPDTKKGGQESEEIPVFAGPKRGMEFRLQRRRLISSQNETTNLGFQKGHKKDRLAFYYINLLYRTSTMRFNRRLLYKKAVQ